jgi:hypothetical protein
MTRGPGIAFPPNGLRVAPPSVYDEGSLTLTTLSE